MFTRSVDEAINSRAWRAWALMIDQVCRIMRKATVWVECCPCHKGFLEQHRLEELPDLVKKGIATCPVRCRLTQELPSGELMDAVDTAARASAAQLLVDLVPLGLTAAERRELLEEFDLARAHVLFYMAAKQAILQKSLGVCYSVHTPTVSCLTVLSAVPSTAAIPTRSCVSCEGSFDPSVSCTSMAQTWAAQA